MLVAKRDPFHPAAQNTSHSDFVSDHGAAPAPRLARTMSALQLIGTLLAIPLGIVSFYSMYRANFSVETTCQSLRANIVSMLDKSVDARTRHMLVRRDVETFEQTCGGIDPDATAAFKALLTAEKAGPPPVADARAQRAETKPAETKPKDVARKAEPWPESVARQPAPPVNTVAVVTKSVQADAAESDSAWLAAVRGALTADRPEPAKSDEPAEPAVNQPVIAVAPQSAARNVRPEIEYRATAVPVPAVVAPRLPSMEVGTVPAPMRGADHPVPPGSIPVVTPEPDEMAAEPKSRFSGLIGQIPFVGRLIEPK